MARFQPSTMLSWGGSAPRELSLIRYHLLLSSTHCLQILTNLLTIIGLIYIYIYISLGMAHGPTHLLGLFILTSLVLNLFIIFHFKMVKFFVHTLSSKGELMVLAILYCFIVIIRIHVWELDLWYKELGGCEMAVGDRKG